MTWVGPNIFFIKIVTLETGDMPQKVLFGPIQGRWLRHPSIFKPAMGSCIKIVKQKNLVS
jgi:hypothetical protein